MNSAFVSTRSSTWAIFDVNLQWPVSLSYSTSIIYTVH